MQTPLYKKRARMNRLAPMAVEVCQFLHRASVQVNSNLNILFKH